jgi:hypothetical protein
LGHDDGSARGGSHAYEPQWCVCCSRVSTFDNVFAIPFSLSLAPSTQQLCRWEEFGSIYGRWVCDSFVQTPLLEDRPPERESQRELLSARDLSRLSRGECCYWNLFGCVRWFKTCTG